MMNTMGGMRLFRPTVVFFVLFAPLAMLSQTMLKTASLSCWEGTSSFQTRKAKTPTIRSNHGFAYGEVTAEATVQPDQSRSCSNTVRLYYSSNGKNYRMVYENHRKLEGIGLVIFGWSNSEKQLLFQTREWQYDSDAEVVKTVLVFDNTTGEVRELHVGEALSGVLGSNCEFDEAVVGWQTDHSIVVRVSTTPPTSHDEQMPCVKKSARYVFDVRENTISQAR